MPSRISVEVDTWSLIPFRISVDDELFEFYITQFGELDQNTYLKFKEKLITVDNVEFEVKNKHGNIELICEKLLRDINEFNPKIQDKIHKLSFETI